VSALRIEARDGGARAGVLALAHGEVRTPAFVPLASNASVRGLAAAEVEALGFEMVLGNTFHALTPVALVVSTDAGALRSGGTLAAVAPTVLALLGVPQPEEMTGKSLIDGD